MITEFKRIELPHEINLVGQLMAGKKIKFYNVKEQLIADKLMDKNISLGDIDFITENIRLISSEEDRFEHYYLYWGTEKEERLLSIEKQPTLSFNETGSITNNEVRVTVSCNYY